LFLLSNWLPCFLLTLFLLLLQAASDGLVISQVDIARTGGGADIVVKNRGMKGSMWSVGRRGIVGRWRQGL